MTGALADDASLELTLERDKPLHSSQCIYRRSLHLPPSGNFISFVEDRLYAGIHSQRVTP